MRTKEAVSKDKLYLLAEVRLIQLTIMQTAWSELLDN